MQRLTNFADNHCLSAVSKRNLFPLEIIKRASTWSMNISGELRSPYSAHFSDGMNAIKILRPLIFAQGEVVPFLFLRLKMHYSGGNCKM